MLPFLACDGRFKTSTMTTSHAHILNETTLAQLVSWIGMEETKSIVMGLISQTTASTSELQTALDQNDPVVIKRVAHRIKGAYGNLGCEALCLALQELEHDPVLWAQNAQHCAAILALMNESSAKLFEYINRN